MQKHMVWILLATAFGVCCSEVSEEPRDICKMRPSYGRGTANITAWYYNHERGDCRRYRFGEFPRYVKNHTENKFMSERICRNTCTPQVNESCFEGTSKKFKDGFAYESSLGRCVRIEEGKGYYGTNFFKQEKNCTHTCRDPEYGECLRNATTNCTDEKKGQTYLYDMKSQTCVKAAVDKCGPFPSLESCFLRCGRYVPNKCQIPLLRYGNVKCANNATRYWYNKDTRLCEEITGCDDDFTNFPSAKECYMQCYAGYRRCREPPLNAYTILVANYRHYYNMTSNQCEPCTKVYWYSVRDRNNFNTKEECENLCKPKRTDLSKYMK